MMATRKFEVESGLGASSNDSSSRSNILAALEDAATMDVETEKGKGKDIGENEQNVKNKAREHRFGAFIERWVVYVFILSFIAGSASKFDTNTSLSAISLVLKRKKARGWK